MRVQQAGGSPRPAASVVPLSPRVRWDWRPEAEPEMPGERVFDLRDVRGESPGVVVAHYRERLK